MSFFPIFLSFLIDHSCFKVNQFIRVDNIFPCSLINRLIKLMFLIQQIASSNNDIFVVIMMYVHRFLSVINFRDSDISAEWMHSIKLVLFFLINNIFHSNNFSCSLKNDMVFLPVSKI
jgi:hypothetical protein